MACMGLDRLPLTIMYEKNTRHLSASNQTKNSENNLSIVSFAVAFQEIECKS